MHCRDSEFKESLGDYRNQPNYDESYEPELYLDANDFLILKNMNKNVYAIKEILDLQI